MRHPRGLPFLALVCLIALPGAWPRAGGGDREHVVDPLIQPGAFTERLRIPERSLGLMDSAWVEWKSGNVAQAEINAGKLAETAERSHLLVLCAFVRGDYEGALTRYAKIDPSYEKRAELDEPVIHSQLHSGQYEKAREFARERRLGVAALAMLELRASQPLKSSLNGIAVIPFAKHDLTPYFPAFEAELEGKKLIVHVDTGGTHLIMGPDRAKSLGIELKEGGTGFHATQRVALQVGIAKRFRLGDAILENVPVTVMPTLKGTQDFIIFGTNVLDRFLATLDYPNQRLLLSPRGDKALRQKHLAMLPERRTEIPFYLWGDHYMFARGGFGDRKDLNFFIDSGLVSLAQDKGGVRQACFMTTPTLYKQWGVDADSAAKKHFESPLTISLGPLEQKGQFFATVENPSWSSFGGVRIDGLLSHAFLNKYAWTLDFDKRQYLFSQK